MSACVCGFERESEMYPIIARSKSQSSALKSSLRSIETREITNQVLKCTHRATRASSRRASSTPRVNYYYYDNCGDENRRDAREYIYIHIIERMRESERMREGLRRLERFRIIRRRISGCDTGHVCYEVEEKDEEEISKMLFFRVLFRVCTVYYIVNAN